MATHQIDLEDRAHARGRSYFVVLMPHGVDHWGRYVDEYGVSDGRWLITSRRALTDGHAEARVHPSERRRGRGGGRRLGARVTVRPAGA